MVTPTQRWAADVVLGDGETVHLRPIRRSDAPRLAEFHRRQSPDSTYRRFFSPKPRLTDAELEHFTNVDLVDRVALVVERHGELIAWASYERWTGRDDADAAFQVDDAHQGKGIATLLLEHLAAIARSNGIVRFTAEVLADNRPMLAVFSRAGWPVHRRFDSGVIDLDFALDETVEFLDSVERREQRADSRAMARLLLPRTIAVFGASDRAGSIGAAVWENIVTAAAGEVFPVNPNRATVGGRPAWPSLKSVPGDVMLAVIAVPPGDLDAVIDDCIAAHVRGAVIITSVDGTDVDVAALVDKARSAGVRIIGPGSMGIAATNPTVGLHATLVPMRLAQGPVAVSLQSGSLGASLLRMADRLHMGLSWFVSLGDKSDVSGNDLLQFWEDDETTRVIAMYTETFGNPRKFVRIARRVSRRRPIVAVRTGAAAIGQSGSALYQHAGLIEVPTVAALLDTARVLASQPVLRGPRIAVLSNARSPMTLARAAVVAAGLVPVEPPLRLDWRSTTDEYGDAVRAALVDEGVDGLLVIHAPPLPEDVAAPVAALEDAAAGATKPVVAVLLGGGDGPVQRQSPIPAFSFPEPAAAVLGRLHQYGRWLASEAAATPADFADIDDAAISRVLQGALDRGTTTLDVSEAKEVLAAAGIAAPATHLTPATQAVAAAAWLGYPVAVKAERRHLGRSVQAGVALDLANEGEVVEAVTVMRRTLGDDAARVVVQSMTPPGLDLRIRAVADERIGPLISVGLGGSVVDLIADEHSRLAPLSVAGATALLGESRAGKALDAQGLDPAGVIDTVLRAGQLVADHPEIALLDLNPMIVSAHECWVTDALIMVAPHEHVTVPLRQLG